MARQWALLLVAVQFLTRIPMPALKDFQPDWTARAARYFPLVGAGVGLVSAGVLGLASLVWAGPLPALLAVAAGVLVTGAFHEDGLADAFDGLGGGRTRERRLEIMKDSRIGAFGVLGLGLSLAIKIAALDQAPVWLAMLALIAANGAGRGAAVLAMGAFPYAGDRAWAKVKPVADGMTPTETLIASGFALLSLAPLAFAAPLATGVALVVGGAAAGVMAIMARRLIGGWVGDTLGAVEQVFEAAFLLAFAGVLAVA